MSGKKEKKHFIPVFEILPGSEQLQNVYLPYT